MRYRKLTADDGETPGGDWSFGRGALDFHNNTPDAVAQAVKTRLQLFRGEWSLDLLEGTPWYSDVLGNGHELTYAPLLRARILETRGVTEITAFSESFDRESRVLTVQATINTTYGRAILGVDIPLEASPA